MIHLTPPTLQGYVSSGWGADRSYRGGWHEGLDFHATEGSPVLAAAYGEVAKVDNVNNSFAGNWILIYHPEGFYTRYMHNKKNLVQVGQKVYRGQMIGLVGKTGTTSSAPHVHFDTQILSSRLSEFKDRYGEPSTGFGRTQGDGVTVPSETFMHGVTYRDGVVEASKKRGVYFPELWIDYAILTFLLAWALR